MKNKKYGYIYKTTNLKNKKIYIGQKKGEFNSDYFGSGLLINKAINKEGIQNFKLEIIVYAKDKDTLSELEKQFIADYRRSFGRENMYNMSDGGDGGNTFSGRHHTEEAKEKNRRAHIGHPNYLPYHKPDCQCFCCRAKRGETRGQGNPMFGKVGRLSPFFGRVGPNAKTKWMYNKELNQNKCVKFKDIEYYLKNKWILGRSDEVRQKMRKPKTKKSKE